MKKLFPILVILAFVAGLPQTARAENEKPKKVEILSAFDVATLMEKGSSDADLAKLLAKQRGSRQDSCTLKRENRPTGNILLVNVCKTEGHGSRPGKNRCS